MCHFQLDLSRPLHVYRPALLLFQFTLFFQFPLRRKRRSSNLAHLSTRPRPHPMNESSGPVRVLTASRFPRKNESLKELMKESIPIPSFYRKVHTLCNIYTWNPSLQWALYLIDHFFLIDLSTFITTLHTSFCHSVSINIVWALCAVCKNGRYRRR